MRRAFFEMEITHKQDEILSSTVDNLAISGGLGGGKTATVARYLFLKMARQPGCRIALAAQRLQQLVEADLYMTQELLRSYGVRQHYDANKHILRISNSSQVLLQSFENPSGIVKGPEYDEILFDEHDVIKDRKAYDNFVNRARGKLGSCQIRTFGNSVPQSHFVAQDYKINKLPKHELILVSTYDNRRFLPPGYIERLEARYPKGTLGYRRWLLGEVGLPLDGAVFSEFQLDRDQFELGKLSEDEQERAQRYYALFLHDGRPTTLIGALLLQNRKLVVDTELYLPSAAPGKIVREVKRITGDYPILSDAENPLYEEFAGELDLVPAHDLPPETGIKALRERLAQDALLLAVRGSKFNTPTLAGEFEQHVYAANGEPEPRNNEGLTALQHIVLEIERPQEPMEFNNLNDALAR